MKLSIFRILPLPTILLAAAGMANAQLRVPLRVPRLPNAPIRPVFGNDSRLRFW